MQFLYSRWSVFEWKSGRRGGAALFCITMMFSELDDRIESWDLCKIPWDDMSIIQKVIVMIEMFPFFLWLTSSQWNWFKRLKSSDSSLIYFIFPTKLLKICINL
jgi:hypothetical protein